MKLLNQQRGVGLIEALIAALIFAVGIAAVLQLQGTFFKGGSAANARSAAMSIAEEKLEDLRGFSSSGSFVFTGIGNNTGGSIASGNVSVGNITYALSWAVTNYYYNAGALTTTANGDIVQKKVIITVGWTDTDGTARTASLDTVISSTSSTAATGGLANNAGGSGEQPVVSYTASTDTNVVAIGVGDVSSTKRETLVPTTNASGQVKFTAYTYNASGTLLRQEDFLTVSCNCAFTTAAQTRTASYAKWDSTTGTYEDQAGDLISKDKGWVTNGNNANEAGNPDALCTSCCNDHHDPGASAVDSDGGKYCDPANGVLDRCFDPFRGSADYTSGKHNHYTSNGTLASSGQYLESCRMKRIDGYWRVYQDWHRVDLSAFPLSALTDSTSKALYVTYTKNIINAVLNDVTITKFNGQSFTLPSPKPDAANRTSSNPISLATGGQSTLTARAVYVDYLSSSLLTEVRAKKTANTDYLIHVPFYEVDVTTRGPKCASASSSYGGWCPPDTHEVDVGAGDIADNNGNGLASGVIEGVSTTVNPVNASFTMRRSNSGLMGLSEPVDVIGTTNSDNLRDQSLIAVSVSGSPSTTHTLSVTFSGDTPISGSLSVTPASGSSSCSSGCTSYSTYHYTVPNSVTGSLSFNGLDANGDTCVGSGSYTASSSDQSVTLAINCVSVSTTHTLTASLAATGGTPSTGTLTSTLATGCSGSGTSFTCTEANTASGTATWTYSGTTSSGSSCSGAGTYTASGTSQSVTLAVTCVATRTLAVCLTKANFTSGTLSATPTSGSQVACSTPSGSCGAGANAGTASSCTVTSGVGGALGFTGAASGNKVCAVKTGATSTYGVNDTTFNLEIACQ